MELIKDVIKEQVAQVITYSQGIPNPQVDDLIDKWYEAKKDFIDKFGLIYEYGKVSFHLSDVQKKSKINNFVDRIANNYKNDALAAFVSENSEGFFKNQVTKDYPNIPRGMKLVKAFKYFEKDNEFLLNRLQIEASQIIQEDKIEGILCFSVHPLDYLSSSENTYNWRSCHSLNGDYRAGNLSYMCDKSTIVCYLKGEHNVKLPRFPESVPWNTKKWRMLLHFSDNQDMIMAGRQYPVSTKNALEYVGEFIFHFYPDFWREVWFADLDGEYWQNFIISDHSLSNKYIRVYRKLVPIKDIVTDVKPALQYDDLLYSSIYDPYYIHKNPYFHYYDAELDNYMPHFTIGAHVKCLRCGKDLISYSEGMICDTCECEYGENYDDYYICDCCGDRVLLDDITYIHDDMRVCSTCLKEVMVKCNCCGEYIFKDDAIYYHKDNLEYCTSCICDIIKEEKYHG